MDFWILLYLSIYFLWVLSTCGQLAYLPHKRRDLILDDENIDMYASVESNSEANDDTVKEEKKTRKHGLLNWLKLRVCGIWMLRVFCYCRHHHFLLKIFFLLVSRSHGLIMEIHWLMIVVMLDLHHDSCLFQ